MSTNVLILHVQAGLGRAVIAIAFWRYLRPVLNRMALHDAIFPLLLLQSFRFLGLTFLVDHPIGATTPRSAAQMVALGDFSAALVNDPPSAVLVAAILLELVPTPLMLWMHTRLVASGGL